MKYYFLDVLKKRIPIIIALTLIFIITAILVNNTTSYTISRYVNGRLQDFPKETMFMVYTISIIALCVLIPIVEFSFKMIRIQAWQVYSFPIKREKIFLARYLVGLIEIILPFVSAYLISLIFIFNSDNLFCMDGFWVYFPFAVLAIILLYSYFSFFYCRANNIIDGVATLVLSVATPLMFGLALVEILGRFNIDLFQFYYFSPLFILDYLTKISNTIICNQVLELNTIEIIFVCVFAFIMFLTIVFKGFFNKRIKSEDIDSESNSIFCYKVSLMVIGISMAITFALKLNFMACFIGVGFTYVSYMLYTRSYYVDDKSKQVAIAILTEIAIGAIVLGLKLGGIL